MEIKDQISLCSQHYKRWKDMTLSSRTLEESKNCLEKAFFWLELQTAFIVLFALEKEKTKNPETRNKIMLAKARLCKKLAEYARQTLNEITM